MAMEKDQPISVYTETGILLSHCSRKRAAQMVHRKKARWVDRDKLITLISVGYSKKIHYNVIARDESRCIYCDKLLEREKITFDHLTPRSRGGSDYEDNIGCSCVDCNQDKANRTYEEYFLYLCTQIVRIMLQ
jgi:5-methylcytosine-specific restriction endonuclease McrA